jgi:hypothetical protein
MLHVGLGLGETRLCNGKTFGVSLCLWNTIHPIVYDVGVFLGHVHHWTCDISMT